MQGTVSLQVAYTTVMNDQKVTNKEKAIQCEICEVWWHCKCEKISDEGYTLLNCENIHWFCGACNGGVGRMLPTLTNKSHIQL